MTRVLAGPGAAGAATVLAELPPAPPPGVERIAVVLEDLAGEDARPLGAAVIDLPPGRAGVLVGVTDRPPPVTARLLQGSADHLRALGRLRLTASCRDDARLALIAYASAGFRPVRQAGGRVDLVLEL
jgi:hypothetical protein